MARVKRSALLPKEKDSSCIAELHYNEETQEMQIVFHERGIYSYQGVPPDVFADFNEAGSRGTYFNLYIRDQFSGERIG